MKTLNKKGFVLIEVLIVSTFVLLMFIFIYRNAIPQIGEYEKIARYDDIDSIYNANLLKQFITRYGNTAYIDQQLRSKDENGVDITFVSMNDCDNTNLYTDSNYCKKIMENLNITAKDAVYITDYDISDFREVVETNETFDSGNLSSFRDYINTVSNIETFYDDEVSENMVGKYRLFITRTVTEADQSTSIRYANVGIYTGEYQKYTMGEEVKFDPGTGEQTFYVLKNSPSTDRYLTLIASKNLPDSTIAFIYGTDITAPKPVLEKLKIGTANWANVEQLDKDSYYISSDGYAINYSGYRARLLDENDIMEILGCKEDVDRCFDYTEAFPTYFNQTELSWLISDLTETTGYWTSATVPGTLTYAWSIQKGKVVPTRFNPTALDNPISIGVRPVITIDKDILLAE